MTTPNTTVVPVKSAFLSRTNITAALLALFGILTAFGILPAAASSPEVIGSIVTAGSVLVAYFRTIARSVLN
jgi:hypothetical protein